MTAIYVTFELRRPRDGDPGSVAEAWYCLDGDYCQMTDRDGIPLAGERNRKKLRSGQSAREAAVTMLRERASRFSGSKGFGRQLRYARVVF